jgi:hypothetical protein
MAGEALTLLASAGPFLGVNTTESDIYLPPTKGVTMVNGDCETIPKSLTTIRGRIVRNDCTAAFPLLPIGAIAQADTGVAYNDMQPTPQINNFIAGFPARSYFLVSIPPLQYIPTKASRAVLQQPNAQPSIFQPDASSSKFPFTQAVVASTSIGFAGTSGPSVVFIDDYGLQTSYFGTVPSTQLHYFPPAPVVSAADGGAGTLGADTYYYAYTLVANYTSGQNNGQETSPSFLPTNQVSIAANHKVTLTNTSDGVNAPKFNGTFPRDPEISYTTNIYRSSITQPVWYFVGTTAGGSDTVFTDNLSNSLIASNAQLIMNRDPAPIKAFSDFDSTYADETYFSGAPLEIHKQRLWVFATVNSRDTDYQPQQQLWYSNVNRPWEFDKINNVFLVDTATYQPNTRPPGQISQTVPFNPYTYPLNVSVELPIAMKTLSSVMFFWTTRKMFVLYGDDPSTFLFRKFADLGCLSRASVAFAATESGVGVFWLSENGVYWTDGSSLKYVSEDIRSVITGLTVFDRYNAVGFYTNHTYWISFPNLGQTWGYRTTTNQWHGPLSYAANAVSSVPSDLSPEEVPWPFSNKILDINSVVASRTDVAMLDDWFSAVDETDLNNPQTVLYTSAPQTANNPHIMKEYTHLAITHKKQDVNSTATVTITVDDEIATQFSYDFDLTKGPTQIVTVSDGNGNALRGFSAVISISFTTVYPNPTAPIEIKAVALYGKYGVTNMIPTPVSYE